MQKKSSKSVSKLDVKQYISVSKLPTKRDTSVSKLKQKRDTSVANATHSRKNATILPDNDENKALTIGQRSKALHKKVGGSVRRGSNGDYEPVPVGTPRTITLRFPRWMWAEAREHYVKGIVNGNCTSIEQLADWLAEKEQETGLLWPSHQAAKRKAARHMWSKLRAEYTADYKIKIKPIDKIRQQLEVKGITAEKIAEKVSELLKSKSKTDISRGIQRYMELTGYKADTEKGDKGTNNFNNCVIVMPSNGFEPPQKANMD